MRQRLLSQLLIGPIIRDYPGLTRKIIKAQQLDKRAWGGFLRMSAAGQIFIPDKICISTVLGGQMLLSSPMEGFTALLIRLFPAKNDAETIKLRIAD